MLNPEVDDILRYCLPRTGVPARVSPPASMAAGKFAINARDGFIKGPIPLPWITKAACLPGKTLQVGIALWYLAGLTKNHVVRLSSKVPKQLGVSRNAKSEALRRLEAAGLVSIEQLPGRAPQVTLKMF